MLKTILRLLLLATLVLLAFGLYTYFNVVTPVVIPEDGEAVTIQISKGASYEEVLAQLKDLQLVQDEATFTLLAKRMNYHRDPMRSGRFTIAPGATMVDMIRHLRSGKQATVNVVLTTEREPMNVAAKVARFIEPDSLAIVSLFQDEKYLDSIGYNSETLMTLFIPNTYEFYWNTSPRTFVERMLKEHRKFWNEQRKAKAEKLGLNPAEVYTLASIVERETLRNDKHQP
ncbi:MAG: endolytic transglycosylase MltG, partial [Bacteroidota bacterium]